MHENVNRKTSRKNVVFLTMMWLLTCMPPAMIFAGGRTDDKAAFQTMMFISDGRGYADTSAGAAPENIDAPAGTRFCDFGKTSFTVDADRHYTVLLSCPEKTRLSDNAVCIASLPAALDSDAGGVVAVEVWDGDQRVFREDIIFVNPNDDINYEFIPVSANTGLKSGNHEVIPLDISGFFGRDGAKIRSDIQYIDFSFRTVPVVPEASTANQESTAAEPLESQQPETSAETAESASDEPVAGSGHDYNLTTILLMVFASVLSIIAIIMVLRHKK